MPYNLSSVRRALAYKHTDGEGNFFFFPSLLLTYVSMKILVLECDCFGKYRWYRSQIPVCRKWWKKCKINPYTFKMLREMESKYTVIGTGWVAQLTCWRVCSLRAPYWISIDFRKWVVSHHSGLEFCGNSVSEFIFAINVLLWERMKHYSGPVM